MDRRFTYKLGTRLIAPLIISAAATVFGHGKEGAPFSNAVRGLGIRSGVESRVQAHIEKLSGREDGLAPAAFAGGCAECASILAQQLAKTAAVKRPSRLNLTGFGPARRIEFFFKPLSHQTAGAADNCAVCHQKHDAGTVSLYSSSAHATAGITCDRCHGGEQLAVDKQKAHAGRFVGQPASDQVLAMCGSCHRPQLAMFKTSRHFLERKGVRRVDCVACHGAHTVGSPSRNFAFAYYCSGCHGQEYLPELPRFFPQVLELADYMAETQRAMSGAARQATENEIARTKEIRRRIAEIVHPTDLAGSVEKAPEILKLGEELKQIIKQNQ